MRWCLPIAVFLGLSVTDVVSRAQGQGAAQRPGAQRSSSGYGNDSGAGYFATTGVARFQLIQGRLKLDEPRHRKGSQSQNHNGVYESVTVTAKRGIPSVHYIFQTKSHHLTLSVEDACHVRIESWFPQTRERAKLDQPPTGAITWTIDRGQLHDEYKGATLLHVRQSDPAGFDLHCGCLIERLLHGRSIRHISKETTQALLSIVSDYRDVISQDDVLSCVDRLCAKKSATRRSAERQLLAWGTPIIPIANSIPRDNLDLEQQHRLAVVLKRLRRVEDDTPTSLATMLANDRDYWQHLTRSLSQSQMLAAAKYLDQAGIKVDSLSTPVVRIADGSR